jgi:hypothetical protein
VISVVIVLSDRASLECKANVTARFQHKQGVG